METLQNIIPQIGYGFVCSFWQMALLFGFYKLATAVYLPAPAERFRFAFVLSIVGSFWFLYTIIFGKPSAEWQGIAAFSQNIPETLPSLINQSMYWFGWIYLCMFCIASLKGRLQWKTTLRMMNSGKGKAPVEWRMFIKKYAALLGIKKNVILKVSGIFSPATFGFFKPVILIPVSCLTGLNSAQLQAILLHELAHIRRGDYLAAWVLQLAGILMYFNPFMHQLVREAKKECEHACDDLVMQFEYNPLDYAQALLSVAKNGQNLSWALQAQGSQHHLLLHRITRLLGQQDNKNRFSRKSLCFSILAAVLFLATSQIRQNESPSPVITKAIFYSPTPITAPPKTWNQSLLDARLAILAAATGKSAAIENAKQVAEMQVVSEEELLAKNSEESPVPSISPASLILSANWADEQQAATGIQEIEKGWKQFTLLLEKLDLTGDLDEKEWEQVAGLIALYADIRKTIYEETARSQNLTTYTSGLDKDLSGKILVIVHEEATGKLAASFMNPDEINETYSDDNLDENRQQVILLRKKAPAGKKIIRL